MKNNKYFLIFGIKQLLFAFRVGLPHGGAGVGYSIPSTTPNPKFAEHHHPRCAPLSGASRCSARQFWLAEHRIRPYRGLRGTLTCSANFGLGPGSFSRHPRAGPRLPWRRCVFGRGTCTANRPPTPSSGAGPHPFSTPAPNTPDTCTKNRHYLRQPSCFPVIRVFRQNAAREGRSYAPSWGSRCASGRYRHLPHRNHRHKAQKGASCAPAWRRAIAEGSGKADGGQEQRRRTAGGPTGSDAGTPPGIPPGTPPGTPQAPARDRL